MQVYLPEDLYRAVKDRGLPASELLQRAVQAELRRQGLLEETERYLQDLVAEVGAPNANAMAKQTRSPGGCAAPVPTVVPHERARARLWGRDPLSAA